MSNETVKLTFGEPESVIEQNWLDYLGVFPNYMGNYYVPPVSLVGLAKMRGANAHHGSCMVFRRNMLGNAYAPDNALPVGKFRAAAMDFLSFGHAYIKLIRNIFGQIVDLDFVPGLNIRRKIDGNFCQLLPGGKIQDFMPGEILQVMEYDCMQQIYGMPDWVGGLQATLLNQDATLFRRRYYANGGHLGYIFYSSSSKLDEESEAALKEKIQAGKGAGNFRTMFVHIPGGDEKSIQIIPVGDINQKDEFEKIKNLSSDDVCVAHRVPPALLAIKPSNTGGFGDIDKIKQVYIETEVQAMAQPWMDINNMLPRNLQFKFNFNIKTEGKTDGKNN